MSLIIRSVHLPYEDVSQSKVLYTVYCVGGRVKAISNVDKPEFRNADYAQVDGRGGLLLPSPLDYVIHTFILINAIYSTKASHSYPDFPEALQVTAAVKRGFKNEVGDLYKRGEKLIRASVEAGVTSMRAHVEVDATVIDACVNTAAHLKADWAEAIDVQIALFMQDPLFDSAGDLLPGSNCSHLENVLSAYAERSDRLPFSVIGSAPYVERTRTQQLANISHILTLAIKYNLHADFHLDYDLTPLSDTVDSDSASEPLIYSLLTQLRAFDWTKSMRGKTVTVGHATRLSLFSPARLHALREAIGDLPVHFVGLPQSDVYMMGRGDPASPRGTLNVSRIWKEYGLNVAMAVNNVGNAFTPQGAPDPLSLCPLGVAVYQDGTVEGCKTLIEAVTIASKRAIGDDEGTLSSLVPNSGSPADFVVLLDNSTLHSAALEPSFDRMTIKAGRVVAWRKSEKWTILDAPQG